MVSGSNLSFAQTSILGNNSANTTHYLGWDASTTFDLNVEHKGDYQIWMSTNGARRLLIDDGNTGNMGLRALCPCSKSILAPKSLS